MNECFFSDEILRHEDHNEGGYRGTQDAWTPQIKLRRRQTLWKEDARLQTPVNMRFLVMRCVHYILGNLLTFEASLGLDISENVIKLP